MLIEVLDAKKPLEFRYTNHRGEEGTRRVCPWQVHYGTLLPYYPEPQWLMTGYDCDKEGERTFALAKMLPVVPQ